MIEATNLKTGVTFSQGGTPYKVVKYTHTKIARGGGNVKLSVKNLRTGKLEVKTLNSNSKVDKIETAKKSFQFLYKDKENASFMDTKTYDQIEIPIKKIEDQLTYIKEGQEVSVLFLDETPLSVDIPPKVTLTVKETAPGVKGNSASNMFKPATLENGLKLKVPLFIKVGDKIRVDTRSREYIERTR